MGLMDGTPHFEDSMTTQRLYWYRKQRLTHSGPTRGYVQHQMPNITETYRPSANGFHNSVDTSNGDCIAAMNTVHDNGRLSSCRFDKSEGYSTSSTEGKDTKLTAPKKDLSNLPPLDISEVIETLTTLSSEGKLGKCNSSSKEGSDDENVKIKGKLLNVEMIAFSI